MAQRPKRDVRHLGRGPACLHPLRFGKVYAGSAVAMFLSAATSGRIFILPLSAINGMDILTTAAAYIPMAFGTTAPNRIILAMILIVWLQEVLKR